MQDKARAWSVYTNFILPGFFKVLNFIWDAAPFVGIVGVGHAESDRGPLTGELGIEFDEFLLILRHVFLCVTRGFRAFRNADGTVDALIGIDHKEIRTFPEAVHRADVHAVGTLAADAGFADNMRHDERGSSSEQKPA